MAEAALTPLNAALKGVCPRCGKGRLFGHGLAGIVSFAPRCSSCGLDYQAFNVGDGAASFLILIVGAIVTGGALWLELSREPPWWVHALLWGPLTVILSLALMRIAKGLLLGIEFGKDAREGHL